MAVCEPRILTVVAVFTTLHFCFVTVGVAFGTVSQALPFKNKKFELMLTRRAKVYSSFGLAM